MALDAPAPEALAFADYWNRRYQYLVSDKENPEFTFPTYEWLRTFDDLKQPLQEHIPPASDRPKMPHLGCGNSEMEEKYADLEVVWLVTDVRKMDLPDYSFDVAIDKSTMDAMNHGSLLNPPDDVIDSLTRYADEVIAENL
ncbi:MAG: hypothetical protein MMC23_007007 [Stictis urceolatum]|nr:hypothetical protein [Stictis urceolata]